MSDVGQGVPTVRQLYNSRAVRPGTIYRILPFSPLIFLGSAPRRAARCGESPRPVCSISCELLRHLAYGEVRLLLTGATLAKGHAPDLRNRPMGAGMVRLDSHLAGSRLRRPGQEVLLPPSRSNTPFCFGKSSAICVPRHRVGTSPGVAKTTTASDVARSVSSRHPLSRPTLGVRCSYYEL